MAHSAVAAALHICKVVCINYGCSFVRCSYRQAEVERRAAVGIVCGPEFSSMGGNDGTADRKAQPHPLRFCGEERLEDLFHFFLRYAGAPVGNGYGHCARAIPILNSSANEQPALRNGAISHRVTSVHHQVD